MNKTRIRRSLTLGVWYCAAAVAANAQQALTPHEQLAMARSEWIAAGRPMQNASAMGSPDFGTDSMTALEIQGSGFQGESSKDPLCGGALYRFFCHTPNDSYMAAAVQIPTVQPLLSADCRSKRSVGDMFRRPLRVLSRAVRTQRTVRVLAIGSSSTVGIREVVSGPVSSILPSADDLMTPRGPNFFRNSGSFG